MARIVLVAVALAMYGVTSSYARMRKRQMPEGASVWRDNQGLQDDISYISYRTIEFDNFIRYLKDALEGQGSQVEPAHILAVLKGPLRDHDVPEDVPVEKKKVYHVFFVEKDNPRGTHYLPMVITKFGRGWTKAEPYFYYEKDWVMEATHHSLHRERYDAVAEFWEEYLRKRLENPDD